MANFNKNNFNYSGGYLTYNVGTLEKPKYVFIARFRNGSRSSFISFLIKNFSVQDYLSRLDNREAPLEILNSAGYISPNVRKVLKSYRLPATQEGLVALRAKRME